MPPNATCRLRPESSYAPNIGDEERRDAKTTHRLNKVARIGRWGSSTQTGLPCKLAARDESRMAQSGLALDGEY
jgi:hypothetical protein